MSLNERGFQVVDLDAAGEAVSTLMFSIDDAVEHLELLEDLSATERRLSVATVCEQPYNFSAVCAEDLLTDEDIARIYADPLDWADYEDDYY